MVSLQCFSLLTLLVLAASLPASGWAAVSAEGGHLSEAERQSVVEALETSQNTFEELVGRVDPNDWFVKPAPEKWSVGEVAEHILLSEKMLFGFVEQALAGEPNPDWQTATAGKMERIEQFMPNRGIKAQAPGPLEPTGEVSHQDCLSQLAAARARTVEFAKKTQTAVKQYTMPHPAEFFGDLNVYQWLHFIAAHHARHNAQIAEVMEWTERERTGVVRSGANAFSIRHEAFLSATGDEIYIALTDGVSDWWDPDHTYSGDSANLSIDARPQGCFCEALTDGGGVSHLTVVHANPGKTLRLTGGLGPLQAESVAGSMSWTLKPQGAGTLLVLTYNVAGTLDGGLDTWAPIIGQVLKGQFQRLVDFVEGP